MLHLPTSTARPTEASSRETPHRPRDGRHPVRHGVPRDRRRDPPRVRPLTAATEPQPRVRLYDADGHDREIDLTEGLTRRLGKRNLLWVDADRADHDIAAVGAALGLETSLVALLEKPTRGVDLTKYEDHLHLVLEAIEPSTADGDGPATSDVRRIDLVGGRDWVLTVHDGPVAALERLDAVTEGETRLGALDAAGFVADVADEVLTGYLELVEDDRARDRPARRARPARRSRRRHPWRHRRPPPPDRTPAPDARAPARRLRGPGSPGDGAR